MTTIESELSHLLELIADEVDLNHCDEVDERYRRALAYEEVDHPPLVIQSSLDSAMTMPAPWGEFHHYSYRQIFDSPAAMMQNMLLERVVPGLLLKDDSPLALRNDHGTLLAATALGVTWQQHKDDHPWAKPISSPELLEGIAAAAPAVNIQAGLLGKTRETLQFYRDKLSEYPPCARAIQVSMPDLQGPFDTAEQLWGSEIYLAFFEQPELLGQVLSAIAETTLALAEAFRPYALDRLDPLATTQHGYMIPGRFMVRNDSAIMLSAAMYAEFVRDHDAHILSEVGGGCIHFCGDGQHLIAPMLQIPDLRGLDFGESWLMDLETIYAQCSERRVAITSVRPPREDLVSGKSRRQFPTGVVFVYWAGDLEDAKAVVREYKE